MNLKVSTTLLQACLFCGLSLIFYSANAGNPAHAIQAANLMTPSKQLLFEENKGQLMDENRNPATGIKYFGHSSGVYVYFKPGMLSFIYTKTETDKSIS